MENIADMDEQQISVRAKNFVKNFNGRVAELPKKNNRALNTDFGRAKNIFNALVDAPQEESDKQ
jgi:hypothetical protein